MSSVSCWMVRLAALAGGVARDLAHHARQRLGQARHVRAEAGDLDVQLFERAFRLRRIARGERKLAIEFVEVGQQRVDGARAPASPSKSTCDRLEISLDIAARGCRQRFARPAFGLAWPDRRRRARWWTGVARLLPATSLAASLETFCAGARGAGAGERGLVADRLEYLFNRRRRGRRRAQG